MQAPSHPMLSSIAQLALLYYQLLIPFFFLTHLFILIYNYISFQVTPIPGKADTLLAQTTDFFYPLVDDPYMQVLPIKHCHQRHNGPRLLSLKLE